MELVAIAVGLVLGQGAGISDTLFWTSLIVSLSCGLIAAWPVNVALIHFGVKEGMMDPRMTGHGGGTITGDPGQVWAGPGTLVLGG